MWIRFSNGLVKVNNSVGIIQEECSMLYKLTVDGAVMRGSKALSREEAELFLYNFEGKVGSKGFRNTDSLDVICAPGLTYDANNLAVKLEKYPQYGWGL